MASAKIEPAIGEFAGPGEKGVRRDVDLYAKYMSGAFGAVPRV